MKAIKLKIHVLEVDKPEHISNNFLLAKHSISVLFFSHTFRLPYLFLITAPF